MNINEYFKELETKVKICYDIAEQGRKKGLDPRSKVEVPLATSLAGRVAGLISAIYPQLNNPQLVNRILELEKEYGSLEPAVCLKIAEETAKEKFCKFTSLIEGIDAGLRVAFGYLTLGVVAAPLEGYTHIELKKTRNGEDYFSVYFSGPIGGAGRTAASIFLVIVDYLREIFGYARYDVREEEVKRAITEIYDRHERVNNLQYLPTEKEIDFLVRNLAIEINGDPTEEKEVSNYKDLERIQTNRIRSGFCLILAEGLAQKAPKIVSVVKTLRKKGFKLTDWDFIEKFVELQNKQKHEQKEEKETATYIKDLVAGRPVFGHPSRSGAFRLRYGRARNSGYSCIAIHPATMEITDGFLAIGTQIKTELPAKGGALAACDSIDGPIVKMKDGSVKKIKDKEEAKNLYNSVEEIIYLGDLLIPYGDFLNRNHVLMPSGYCEQEWFQEYKIVTKEKEEAREIENIYEVDFYTARDLSYDLEIPLHPSYIFYWSQISYDEFLGLLDWLGHARFENKIILPYNKTEKERFARGKRALELIGLEHEVVTENIIINSINSEALLLNLGLDYDLEHGINKIMEATKGLGENVLELINKTAKVKIKDKAGTFIGSRMGRPEKGKLRKLIGSPNVLFPVGEEGGRLRSVNEACNQGSVKADFPIYMCKKCQKETIYFKCENCGEECEKLNFCPECKQKFSGEVCREHVKGQSYTNKRIEVDKYFNYAIKQLDLLPDEVPKLIKGVKGTSNKNHVSENLAKGLLRALLNLQVNKDGTIRFDATELPLTHFKPVEIGTGVEKLRELGYVKDIYGRELENNEQILEILPHDILLPCCPESNDEKADDVFIRIAHFIDLELSRFYGLKQFYNIRSREDLVGQMVALIAPHNCAAVIGRIIGFTRTQALIASPYIHAACRRDCVAPTTKVFIYDDDSKEICYEEIGDYVEKLIRKGASTKKIDNFGTLSVENKKNAYVFGINPETHELTKKKIKFFIKGPETKEWIKITTATNREYVMTPTHKFMFIENGEFKFKEAKEARENDKLPVLENFNFNSDVKELNLIKIFKEKLTDKEQKEILVSNNGKEQELLTFDKIPEQNAMIRHRFSHHKLPVFFKITPELMRILGYYASEGYSRQNKSVSQVSFRICNKEMQDYLIELIKNVFDSDANLGEDNTKITICSKLVYYLLKCLGAGRGAYEKRVPNFIFGLEKDLAREYISAYFEGDGSVIKSKGVIAFYSVSRSLLDDIALLLAKFKIFARYFRTGLRMPGKKVLERYEELGKEPKQHILNHLVLGIYDSFKLGEVLNLVNTNKKEALSYLKNIQNRYLNYNGKQILLASQSDYVVDYVKKTEIIKDNKNSYCVEIDWQQLEDRNILWGEQIINTRCDGDEIAVMLLMDLLLNFSREFLPAHRGGTQDAPLVLNVRIRAGEVDDMIFNVDIEKELPLELYCAGRKMQHPSSIKISQIKDRLGGNEFRELWYEYETSDINNGVLCSNYKKLASMKEKVERQMQLVEKIRAVDTSDVARLIIDRHFIRDIRGNLRKFSQQEFRCSKCNTKYRRPPLVGKCLNCGGNIIFTISEGSIIKYLEPAIALANKYDIPAYMKQSLELTKSYIESIFGREKEKQEALKKWF